jgi:signal transduction histidine kinase
MRRSTDPNCAVPGDAVLDQLALRHSELLVLLDESAAMNAVTRRIRELGGFDMSLVGRVEYDGAMVHRSWLGTRSTALHRLLVPEGHGLGGKSLLQRRPVWVRDYLASSSITHEFDELVAREGIRAMLAVPMIYDGEVLGAVYVGVRDKASFGQQVVSLVEEAAGAASVTLVSSRRARIQTRVAVEADRRRKAAELHDSVSPLLFRIGAELRSLRAVTGAEGVRERVEELERQVQDVTLMLRSTLAELNEQPPERHLAVSIQEDCEAFEERTGTAARYVPLAVIPDLGPGRNEALLGVVREALVNVEKHAHASTVVVTVSVVGDTLSVAVADDGRGWPESRADTAPGHLGLSLAVQRMQRLGGGVVTSVNDDGGSTVRAWVPCPAGDRDG